MATSGIYNLSYTLNEILEEAFQQLQIASDGESLSGDMFNKGKRALNIMLKAWENQGLHLWTYEEGTLFLEVGRSEYPFGDSDVHVANTFYQTDLDADEASGQTVLSVTSTANMTNGNPIGIVLDDNTLFWSTISSFVTNDTVTIGDALTGAAASGNVVYHYPDTFKPVARLATGRQAVRRRESEGYEVPINNLSREDYQNLPNKNQNGTVIQTYYSRLQPTGTMFCWNAPVSAEPLLRFSYERRIQIMDESTDTFDLPEQWYEAVVYNLAERLIPKYSCTPDRAMLIRDMAKSSLDNALGFDTANYPITVNMMQS